MKDNPELTEKARIIGRLALLGGEEQRKGTYRDSKDGELGIFRTKPRNTSCLETETVIWLLD